MWIFLCLLSAVTSGLASIIMKKCSENNNAKSIALIGLATSNILYIIVSILFTDVLTNFSIKNFLQIAPLTICQMIGYICGILSVKYASVSTVIPIRKCNTIVTLVLGILILNESIPILKLILSLILVILTILIVSNLSYRFCLVDGQVSLAQPIHSSSIIITIIGSYFILKEKISKKKWLMIVGVIICVMLLSI